MSNFELIVLSIQKTFRGTVVTDYPGKGTPLKNVVSGRFPEGLKPVNSPPVGGQSKQVNQINLELFEGE